MVMTEQSTVEQSTTEQPVAAVQNYARPDIDAEIYTGPLSVMNMDDLIPGHARSGARHFPGESRVVNNQTDTR